MAKTLHELLSRAAEQHPDRVAIMGPEGQLSYRKLRQKARQLAGELIAQGVTPGAAVGLSLPKSNDAIVAAYGIMMVGACYVPIDPFTPVERAIRIARNVDLRVLITSNDRLETLASALTDSLPSVVVLTPGEITTATPPGVTATCWYTAQRQELSLPETNADSLAYVLHTSGSTGFPKGVAISHRSALTFVDMAAEFFAVTADDRLCSQAPLHFDLSVFDLYIASRQGAAIVLIPEYYSAFPKKIVAAIRDYKITVWNSVVSALTLMMERGQPGPESFDSVRLVLFSGEAMPIKYLRMLKANFLNAELFNGYGQTEANTSMYYQLGEIPPDEGWRIPIGRAFPHYDVFAMDDEGDIVTADGTEGELYIRSEAVANGYWGNRDATVARFVPDPRSTADTTVPTFRTGDKVRLNTNGDYLFVGRSDDMIKSRGYRIELGEIDLSLLSCEGVEAAACLAIPDTVIGNKLIAFVSSAPGVEISEEQVTTHCRQQLASYMVPEEIFVQQQLPRTSTGKIDRTVLREQVSLAQD